MLSNRTLIMFFVGALMVMLLLQWSPDRWLQQQLVSKASEQGIVLQLDKLSMKGFTVVATAVVVQLPRMNAIIVNRVQLSPDWSQVWDGEPGVHISAAMEGGKAEATLLWLGAHQMMLKQLKVAADLVPLRPLWYPYMEFPVDLRGQLALQGDVMLHLQGAIHPTGHLQLRCLKLATSLTGIEQPLGDYLLQLDGEGEQPWQWQLSGGKVVLLDGHGAITTAGPAPQAWGLSGTVVVKDGQNSRLLRNIMQRRAVTLQLSGSMAHARLLPLL